MPETRCVLALVVSFDGKAYSKQLICKDAGLRKTIPLLNLNVNLTIKSDNVVKVVVDDDFIGDDAETETHVLRVCMGVLRYKLARLMPQNLAPEVLMVELMRSLAMVRSAVGVLLLPG
jgi:hypothetical protein